MIRGHLWSVGSGALLLAAVAATPTPAPAIAAQLDDRSLFEEGGRLYREADYAGALERYQTILDGGRESGRLYYNLGNCYFKLGDLGRSILNYERALRLLPGDADTEANLALARSLIADDITPLPGFWLLRFVNWWTQLIPQAVLVPLLLLTYLGMMLAVVTKVLGHRAGLERWARRVAVLLGSACAILAVNLVVVEFSVGRSVQGVILADEAPVQSAPSEDRSLQLFAVHEGTKVRVDQRSGAWAEVVLADGKVGWVKVSALEII